MDNSEYWDFCLTKDDGGAVSWEDGLQTECLATFIDTNEPDCIFMDEMTSVPTFKWSDAVSEGITLYNIGLTGVDNGLISFRKDRITNEEFLKLFTGSTLTREKDDYRFHLKQVTGNTMLYDYPADITMENGIQVIKLNGGFYQGFFKAEDEQYQVLPHRIDDDWAFEFTLKREEYEPVSNKTLNDAHPNNKGFFFYMGTRAENKWWHLYNHADAEEYPKRVTEETFCGDDNFLPNMEPIDPLVEGGFDKPCVSCVPPILGGTDPIGIPSIPNESCNNTCKLEPSPYWLNYYVSWYDCGSNNNQSKDPNCNICPEMNPMPPVGYENLLKYLICRGELKPPAEIEEELTPDGITTTDGIPLDEANMKIVKTDNKYVIFNRTCTGETVNTFDPEAEYEFVVKDKPNSTTNYFTLFNRTPTGYTSRCLPPEYTANDNDYKLNADIYNNALGFRIKDDGSIGYRLMAFNCELPNKYEIKEEYSLPGIIPMDEWVTVDVVIRLLNDNSNPCADPTRSKVKIYFYVDGRLKFISRELANMNFRALNETPGKQEGVPYNISLGGGTQGLCDMVMPNFRALPTYILPIEENFAGTFIGKFKSFKFYPCGLTFNQIAQNVRFEKEKQP